MKNLYFGVPFNYKYDWSKASTGDESLSDTMGRPVKFICNSALYNGDAYGIQIEEDEEEIFFKLKYGFEILDSAKAEEYLSKRKYDPWDL